MRFLADEGCDFAAVRALRATGHDVLAVGEFLRRSVDKELLELAMKEDRILLTEDKDFGWLVFAGRNDSPGVILIRFPAGQRSLLPGSVSKLISDFADKLTGSFVVLRPGSVRFSAGTARG